MELKTNNELVEAAAKTPQVFVNASLGEGEEHHRGMGIQLTKEQIISLKKYETLGLSLPVRLQDVIAYLNYGAGDEGGKGLTASDFLLTFTLTYNHAKRWSPLRRDIMLTGNELKIFAGSILRTGYSIVEVYEDLKISKYLEEHNINTPEEYLKLKMKVPGLPSDEVSPGDVNEIRIYLNDLLFKVTQCHQSAESVRTRLNEFGHDMLTKVLPQIRLRLEFVKNNTYGADIQVLQDEIDQRSKEIEDLNKQYDQMVQEAIKAAATLNVGGLILGIYQGVKAEQIRTQRNKLKDLQRTANQLMASKSQTLSSLNRVRDDLQNLSYVAVEAEVATQNLMLVWNALSNYIAASMQDVTKLDEATSLRRFKNQILSIVEPWEQIKVGSDQLLSVFAEADKEYESNRLVFGEGMAMRGLIYSVDVPVFNVVKLRGHNAEVQGANTSAQMLFEQFDYLPGTVVTMNSVAFNINKITFELRKNAQDFTLFLERAEKKLKGYQAELVNPEDADEVREDMEVELNNLSNKVCAHAEDLKSIQRGISIPYDREAPEGWIVALTQDRIFTEDLKIKTEEKLAELTEQMKSVSEAIDLIAKAGVEKIGEEAQLSLESLKALGLAPPQVQVALFAVDMLKKIISGIGEAISFLNMVAAYNRLAEKATDLRAHSQKYARHILQIDGKITLVKTLNEVDDGRSKYVNEFSKLKNDVEKFSREFKQDASISVEKRADSAMSKIAEVVKYMKPVYQ
ncbi:alpha-xenorhabdolysin family binary toxin subunit A [Pseudomonas sp. Sample_10]|uniref:alpha-xenorhabdolysin family binary toxin subunit A n=1 Tax=Pseudomonas sp. Sample_10 TaxID=2448269 RepID=UPI0010360169|nr:alpha-xenorhabdolysin family binary toxin subunit A [Pseudomonas sp. Sample_10]